MEIMGQFCFKRLTMLLGLPLLCLLYLGDASKQRLEFDLYKSLFSSYDTNIMPREGLETINVNITFYLMALLRFAEREETLISSAWLSITWEDRFLKWTAENEYENITKIIVKQNDIWKPDILLMNTVEDYKGLGSDDRLVTVSANGKVDWEPGHRFKTSCSVDTQMYPFDNQKCLFQFSTWTHIDGSVTFSSTGHKISLDYYEQNGEWEVISTSTQIDLVQYNGNKIPRFSATVELHRRRMYYILTVCVPILILSILNCLVYLLPPDSGEKISFCLTILLAYMVYLSFLTDNLPRTSETSSYVVMYLSLMICLSFLSVANSVIVLNLWLTPDQQGNQSEAGRSGELSALREHRASEEYMDITETQVKKITADPQAFARRLDRILLFFMSSLTVSITVVITILLLK